MVHSCTSAIEREGSFIFKVEVEGEPEVFGDGVEDMLVFILSLLGSGL